jgi:hypothetical protein
MAPGTRHWPPDARLIHLKKRQSELLLKRQFRLLLRNLPSINRDALVESAVGRISFYDLCFLLVSDECVRLRIPRPPANLGHLANFRLAH